MVIKSQMEQYRPEKHTPSEGPMCRIGQNYELGTAHTHHKDEDGHAKQPPQEVIKVKIGW